MGRVPDLRVRVQILDYYMSSSPSTSTGWWVRVWYILYTQQYCISQSLKRESLYSYKPGTQLQLLIVHVNSLFQYICLTILYNLVQWHFILRIAMYWLSWLTITTYYQFNKSTLGRAIPFDRPISIQERRCMLFLGILTWNGQMTLKVKVNDSHIQYQSRESKDAHLVQIW